VSEIFGPEPSHRSFLLRQAKRGRIDVWLAKTDSVRDATILRRCKKILSRGEIDSCSAFHRAEDRRRALVSRALLRETLSRYAPVRPEAWEFVAGAHGKPAIAAPAGLRLRFNLSHTDSLVACALTVDDEVGVDLEDATRALDPLELAERVFSPGEIVALQALAPQAQRQRFFESWTLKEAYLKARGLGFALDPQSASFDLGEQHRMRASFTPEAEDHPGAWWFALLGARPGHVLALATRNGGRRACVRTFLATPGDAQQTRRIKPRLYVESQRPDPLS
jgi:4'-phosphopantetheinyl transferase